MSVMRQARAGSTQKAQKDDEGQRRCASAGAKKAGRESLKSAQGVNDKALASQELGIESQDNLTQAASEAQQLTVETKVAHAEIVKSRRERLRGWPSCAGKVTRVTRPGKRSSLMLEGLLMTQTMIWMMQRALWMTPRAPPRV